VGYKDFAIEYSITRCPVAETRTPEKFECKKEKIDKGDEVDLVVRKVFQIDAKFFAWLTDLHKGYSLCRIKDVKYHQGVYYVDVLIEIVNQIKYKRFIVAINC
jgi:hypothetical protein